VVRDHWAIRARAGHVIEGWPSSRARRIMSTRFGSLRRGFGRESAHPEHRPQRAPGPREDRLSIEWAPDQAGLRRQALQGPAEVLNVHAQRRRARRRRRVLVPSGPDVRWRSARRGRTARPRHKLTGWGGSTSEGNPESLNGAGGGDLRDRAPRREAEEPTAVRTSRTCWKFSVASRASVNRKRRHMIVGRGARV